MHAQDIHNISLAITPQNPYVDQWCELILTIDTVGASALRDLRIDGLPEADSLATRPLAERPLETLRIDGRTIERRRYRADVRPLKPGPLRISPVLRAVAVQRRSTGMFSSWRERTFAERLPDLRLNVRPWPNENRPANFDGTVGKYSLSGDIDPPDPAVGDLVRVSLTLSGRGWLGNGALSVDPPAPGWRIYAPEIVKRDPDGGFSAKWIVIPDRVDPPPLPAVRFAWFDPEAERYVEDSFGPESIDIRPAEVSRDEPEQIVIEPPPQTPEPRTESIAAARRLHLDAERLAPPLAFAALLLLTLATVLHPRVQKLGRLPLRVILATGTLSAIMAYRLLEARARRIEVRTRHESTARIYPSNRALVVDTLPPDRALRLLERSGKWALIAYDDTTAWIAADDISPANDR